MKKKFLYIFIGGGEEEGDRLYVHISSLSNKYFPPKMGVRLNKVGLCCVSLLGVYACVCDNAKEYANCYYCYILLGAC